MKHEAPHYDEHPERSINEWQTLMSNGVVDTDFKPTKEYLDSEQGQREIEAQNKAHDRVEMVDRLIANAREQVENGRYTNVEFERLKKKYEAKKEAYQKEADEQSEAAMQDFSETFLDRNSVGTPEEEWIDSPEIFSRKELHREATDILAAAAELEDPAKEQLVTAINNVTEAARDENDPDTNIVNTNTADADTVDTNTVNTNTVDADTVDTNTVDAGTVVKTSNQEAIANRAKKLETLGNTLDGLRFDLAELFVKKNRILGPKHRDEYEATKTQYETALKEYLQLKTQLIQESDRTQQQINDELLKNYIEEDNKLLEAVRDRVDNGSRYRRIISRTIGNEYEKKAMLANGVSSLGVAGAANVVGIAPGYQASSTAPESASGQVAPAQSEVPPAQSNTSSETSDSSPENPANISANEAARAFKNLNSDRVNYDPNYYGFNNGAIVTDVNPADLNYPDGWYYAKGALRNKHNTTNGVYEEISMIKPDGTPWPSTFTAGNTPLGTSQSSSENPGTTPESVESNSESVAAPVSTETTPETVTNSEERPTAQEVAPFDNLSEKDQRLNEIVNSVNLELLRNRFRNILDENGIEILAMDPAPVGSEQQDRNNDRMENWWVSLNEDQKNAVSQFIEETKDSDLGGAFRNWFNSPTAQEIINGNE